MPNPFFAQESNEHSTINPSQNLKDLYKLLTQSNNPIQLFTEIAKNNPNMAPVLNLLQNGYSPEQVFNMMCEKRGINPQEFMSKLKS